MMEVAIEKLRFEIPLDGYTGGMLFSMLFSFTENLLRFRGGLIFDQRFRLIMFQC